MNRPGGADNLSSGKGHRDENFPVASWLVRPLHRPVILAFYRFARAADDVADHPGAKADDKLFLLDDMQQSLLGTGNQSEEAAALRKVLGERELTNQHALDLLEAFRRDVTKLRYADWAELMDYCRYSAMPVGRFVLDVHGESKTTWPASDALCAALQVINHLQDCGKDYCALDRVYLPQEYLVRENVGVSALAEGHASPGLKRVIHALALRTCALLGEAKPFSGQVHDPRLGVEVAVIQKLAEELSGWLLKRDPLSERTHHSKVESVRLAFTAMAAFAFRRSRNRRTPPVAPAG